MGKVCAVVFSVAVTVLAALPASAQTAPPALMVKQGEKSVPLTVSRLAVEARIVGYLAETRMTMTFANPHGRALAGDLYFPLPEGATVSGYALDIDGAMVDGVVVEKDRGRQVFESVVRQGIDPGLVEWTKGNNFKVRVFPIPARGARTVRVDYVSDVVEGADGAAYHLPLRFRQPVADVSLRVKVVKPGAKPTVREGGDGLTNFTFTRWEAGYAAETRLKNATLNKDLVIALPAAERQAVRVEKGPDGAFYFAVNEFPTGPPTNPAPAPKRVTLLWDASGSRGETKHARELALIEAYFARLKGAMAVDLVLFRNVRGAPKRFVVTDGDATALIAALRAVAYDGGTQLGAIGPPKSETADCTLLFTDGLSNVGAEAPAGFTRPVYVFSADATANHAFLRGLAMRTGGVYFNLQRMKDAAVLAALPGTGRQPFSFLGAETDRSKAAYVYPKLTQPVQGRFTLVGRLRGERATVTMRFGPAGGEPTVTVERVVSRADAVDGDLLRRAWAQQRVAELMRSPERNQEDLIAIGKQYGLVTPYTSLIVLDGLEQYVQHGIRPPATLPKVRQAYDAQAAKREADAERARKDKLERIVALWRNRVKWWQTEFTYPKDFKYREEDKKSAETTTGVAPAEEPRDDSGAAPAAPRPSRPDARPPAPAAGEQGRPGNGGGQGFVAGRDREANDGKNGGRGPAPEPGVLIKPWDPKTPYIAALRAAKADAVLTTYLAQRATFSRSPAFFFDCADFLFKAGRKDLAIQVLSNIAELELENAALLRIVGYKLAEEGYLDLAASVFEQVLRQRPEEPQSHRDLALVLARRGRRTGGAADLRRAIDLLTHVVLNTWDRFEEIEVIALMELNALLPRAKALGVEHTRLDSRLVRLLDLDVRIVLTWDADLTDIDLWVVEPSGEKAYYAHNRTTIGGAVSRDFTQGYGPEAYILRKAMRGTYTVQANFYGSRAQTLQGAVTLQVDVFTNFGRPTEKRRTITVRLTEKKETIDIGEVEF